MDAWVASGLADAKYQGTTLLLPCHSHQSPAFPLNNATITPVNSSGARNVDQRPVDPRIRGSGVAQPGAAVKPNVVVLHRPHEDQVDALSYNNVSMNFFFLFRAMIEGVYRATKCKGSRVREAAAELQVSAF